MSETATVPRKKSGPQEILNCIGEETEVMSIAVKNNPLLWEHAKEMACRSGGLCLHSARKMQWATRFYKAHGGTYAGAKAANNRLARWSGEKWRTSSGEKSEGKRRYLPGEAWRRLTPAQIKRTNAAKARGKRAGKQFVRQPADVARVAARVRMSKPKYY